MLVVTPGCGGDRAPAPSAPVAVDVAPAAPITSGPLAESPPPNPERRAVDDAPPTTPPMPTTPTEQSRPGPPFDKGAAAAAIGGVQIQRCSLPGGPTGPGHVTITFEPSGSVISAAVDGGPFPGTAVGGCIARAYGTPRVPPFSGPPVRVGKSFVLP